MRRSIAVLSLLMASVLLMSCSTTVDLVIINKSGQIVEVEYEFTSGGGIKGIPSYQPKQMDHPEWNSWFGGVGDKWVDVPKENLTFDDKNGKVKVKLPPQYVLRILNEQDAIFFGDRKFPIRKINLKGENGTVIYQSDQIYRLFEEKSFNSRFITYK